MYWLDNKVFNQLVASRMLCSYDTRMQARASYAHIPDTLSTCHACGSGAFRWHVKGTSIYPNDIGQ